MTQTIKIAPPNSLVFISDVDGGIGPDPDAIARSAKVIATDSCVAVCCLAEMDGETEITLGPIDEVSLNETPAFDGRLETPTHNVVVSTSERTRLLQTTVTSDNAHLKIWTNRSREPDKIIIGVE
jgi:hypothetical protein